MKLGIDPSIAHMGLSVVGRDGRLYSIEQARTVNTDPRAPLQERTQILCEEVLATLDAYPEIDGVGLEDPTKVQAGQFRMGRGSGLSINSTRLYQAIGAVRAAVGGRALPLTEWQPIQLKRVVGANLRTSNSDFKKMVRRLCPNAPKVFSEHSAHATAAAILAIRSSA